jgi:hypothetical protein
LRIARAELLIGLLLVATACAASPAELGALFSTPEERAQLDRLRRGEAPAQAAALSASPNAGITGYVKRSDGRSTVWIDGVGVSIANPKAAPMLDPKAVRDDSSIRIERRPPK